MNLGYVFLIIMASAAYFVAGIPTPDQMIADFSAAQKFYTSAAYDQAIEKYIEVGEIESRFLDEDKVIVEFGDMQIRIKDATLYQTGNSYSKMAEDEIRKSKESSVDADKQKYNQLALEYVKKASDYFNQTQQISNHDELKVLAQKRTVDAWYLINDYDKVIEEGRVLIEKYPESTYVQDALYNIGWAYYDTKQYEESIRVFQELITRFPTGTKADRALFQIGESYFDQGKYNEAVSGYQRLVDKMRINELTDLEIQRIQRDKLAGLTDETALDLAAKAALKIGACYANSGRFNEASVSYKRIATLFRYDLRLIFEAYNRLATMYLDQDRFDDAIQTYRDAIDDVQDKVIKAQMQVQICQLYYDKGFFEQAIQEYQIYINSYSDVAFRAKFDLDMAFFMLARAHNDLGEKMFKNDQREIGLEHINQSIAIFDRIFEDFPGTNLTERIYFRKALAQQTIGTDASILAAVQTFDKLLELYPETVYREFIIVMKARAYKQLKDYETALTFFNKAIEEYPEHQQKDQIWFEMGVVKTDQGDKIAAVDYLLNVSKKDKRLFTTARLLSANTMYEANRYSDVIDIVSFAVEDPSAVENEYRLSQFYLIRGNAYKLMDNFDSALADYTRAYDLDQPESRQIASVQRAGVYIDQGQFARAEYDLRELMKSDDESIRRMAQMRLAIISVRMGNSDQAINTYLDLYNQTEDTLEKLGFLRNLIQLTSTSENWDALNKYAKMMIESPEAEGKQPEGSSFYFKEEAYYFTSQGYESRANQLEKEGNLAEAQKYYIEAVNNYLDGFDAFPNSYFSSDMLLKVGVLYLTKLLNLPDALDLAAVHFEDYIKKFPNTPNTEMAHYYLGFCFHNGRRFTESIGTFRSFAQKYPNSEFTPEAIFYYSEGEYNLGELQNAIDGFNLLLKRYPKHEKDAEALYTKAWAYLDLEQEDQAISTFKQLVEEYPNSEFASTSLFSIADYYYNIQEYQLALENYELVMEKYSHTEVAEKVPETLKDLKETIAYIEYEKGWNLFSQAQDTKDLNLYRQAAEIFKVIVANYPDTEAEIGAYSNLGVCFEALDRWQDAIDAYDKVIQKYEEGADVNEEAFKFARMHKDYIVANRL